jgi:hypothetical protein
MTILLGLVFCIMNPIICAMCLIYFLIVTATEKYNMLYVNSFEYQSGGQVWKAGPCPAPAFVPFGVGRARRACLVLLVMLLRHHLQLAHSNPFWPCVCILSEPPQEVCGDARAAPGLLEGSEVPYDAGRLSEPDGGCRLGAVFR